MEGNCFAVIAGSPQKECRNKSPTRSAKSKGTRLFELQGLYSLAESSTPLAVFGNSATGSCPVEASAVFGALIRVLHRCRGRQAPDRRLRKFEFQSIGDCSKIRKMSLTICLRRSLSQQIPAPSAFLLGPESPRGRLSRQSKQISVPL
jgi:hypothetical protein